MQRTRRFICLGLLMAAFPALSMGCDSAPALAPGSGGTGGAMGGTGGMSDGMGGTPAPERDAAPPEPFVPDIERATLLYGNYCAFCHGENGEGYLADNANALANPEFLSVASDEFIEQAIRHGRPATSMSAWSRETGGPLYDNDVKNVVYLIRSWATAEPVEVGGAHEGLASRGRPAYNVLCKDCHGENGEGVTAISLNNPWFLATASDGFIRHAIEFGRSDTAMGAYAEQLTNAQVEDLVALIRSWQRPTGEDPFAGFEADLDDAVLNPEGPTPQFMLRDEKYVSVDAVEAAMAAGEKLVLLDARPAGDYARSHITGAISLPFYEVENFVDELPRDTWIIAYCGCPHAVSGQAYEILDANGFDKIAVLDEGFFVWTSRGYPISAGT